MTGEGGAVQMKNYLEKNAGLNGIQVIPLSISDRKALLNEVNRLREEHEIRCVIGTYDPGLHGIRLFRWSSCSRRRQINWICCSPFRSPTTRR